MVKVTVPTMLATCPWLPQMITVTVPTMLTMLVQPQLALVLSRMVATMIARTTRMSTWTSSFLNNWPRFMLSKTLVVPATLFVVLPVTMTKMLHIFASISACLKVYQSKFRFRRSCRCATRRQRLTTTSLSTCSVTMRPR